MVRASLVLFVLCLGTSWRLVLTQKRPREGEAYVAPQHCGASDIPQDITCSADESSGGFYGATRDCTCKQNCHNVTIRCYQDGKWGPSVYEDCGEYNEYNRYIASERLHLKFQNGRISFTCDAGFSTLDLYGSSSVQCINGKFVGRFPSCITESLAPILRNYSTMFRTTLTVNKPLTTTTQIPTTIDPTFSTINTSNNLQIKETSKTDTNKIIIIILSILFVTTAISFAIFIIVKYKDKITCLRPNASYIEAHELQSRPSYPRPSNADPAYLETLPDHHYDEVASDSREPEYEELGPIAEYDDVFNNLPSIPHQKIECSNKALRLL